MTPPREPGPPEPDTAPVGHNGGPPLEHVPEWGTGGIGGYFAWKRAHARAWKSCSWETMIRRQRRAEAVGLSYEEYTLEILERGRHLGPDDADRIAAIKAARPAPSLVASARTPRTLSAVPALSARRRSPRRAG